MSRLNAVSVLQAAEIDSAILKRKRQAKTVFSFRNAVNPPPAADPVMIVCTRCPIIH
jgi:hypothetical protein